MSNYRRLGFLQQLAYGLPQVGINLMGIMVAQWLTFFYVPPDDDARAPLVAAGVFGTLMLVGRIVDGIADPLVGHVSDRSRSRFGRRMPFIAIGTPLLALSFGALWFPPDASDTLRNSVYLGAVLSLYWVAFTVVVGPYYALLPEIARSTAERVSLSSWMAVFTVVGTLAAAIGVGQWQSRYPDGRDVFGAHVGSGIQAFAVFACIAILITFMPVLALREDPDARTDASVGLFSAIGDAFRNPAFRAFLGLAVLVQLGLLLFATGLPYLATTVLEQPGVRFDFVWIHWSHGGEGLVAPGGGEAFTGTLQGALFGLALLSLPAVNWIARRYGKNRVMIIAGSVFAAALFVTPACVLFPDPAVFVLVLVVVLAFPVACALVLVNAIAADVVDYDAARTGERREGIYAGASALIAKSAQGLGPAIVVGLNAALGASRDNPTGILLSAPVAGLLVAVGILIFSRTPVDDSPAT